eukprot:g15679.t1
MVRASLKFEVDSCVHWHVLLYHVFKQARSDQRSFAAFLLHAACTASSLTRGVPKCATTSARDCRRVSHFAKLHSSHPAACIYKKRNPQMRYNLTSNLYSSVNICAKSKVKSQYGDSARTRTVAPSARDHKIADFSVCFWSHRDGAGAPVPSPCTCAPDIDDPGQRCTRVASAAQCCSPVFVASTLGLERGVCAKSVLTRSNSSVYQEESARDTRSLTFTPSSSSLTFSLLVTLSVETEYDENWTNLFPDSVFHLPNLLPYPDPHTLIHICGSRFQFKQKHQNHCKCCYAVCMRYESLK